jgi:hypothetical protein
MERRDLITIYGRMGLIMAAFVLIAGIIAAPILPKIGTPTALASKPHQEPNLLLPMTPASFHKD